MFIKKLYNYNKLLAIAFICFVSCFLFLNYKWGMVATPVYQFGMFSGPIHLTDTQKVYKLYVNDEQLDITKYRFAQKDIMLVSLEKYTASKNGNSEVFHTMNYFFSKMGWRHLMNEVVFTNDCNDLFFTKWFMKVVEAAIGYPVKKLTLYSQLYVWKENKPKPINLPKKEIFIVAN